MKKKASPPGAPVAEIVTVLPAGTVDVDGVRTHCAYTPLAKAMNMGILLMLLVVGGMMAAFASFFISLVRRARQAEAEAESHRAHSEPQEGTAQC